MKLKFETTCSYSENGLCKLGHYSCDRQDCSDYKKYDFDAYDYFDAYLDDKDDGLIPSDYELCT